MTKEKNKFIQILEYAGFITLYYFFKILPFNFASDLGGFLARNLTAYARETRNAKRNLKNSMPELSEEEIKQIINEMWDNLGRNIGEFPHLDKIDENRLEIEGMENIPQNQSAIFFSGHFGNWETFNIAAIKHLYNPSTIYTKIKNKFVEKKIKQFREQFYANLFVRGENALKIAKSFKKGMHLCILADQKINNGIPVEFFGREAMTSPAIAHFAKRYDLPIIPVRILRKGKNFKVKFCHHLDFKSDEPVEKIMLKINKILEEWVKEEPGQWLWGQTRWKLKKLK